MLLRTGAETLRQSKVSASPFISDYRLAAIIVVVMLFVMELATILARTFVPPNNRRVDPVIFALILYLGVGLVLAGCYIACCVAITRRIQASGSRRKEQIKKMNIRFTLSSSGYILLVILEILIYALRNPWQPQILWFALYWTLNWTATLQVIALRPVSPSHSSNTNTGNSGKLNTIAAESGVSGTRGKSADSFDPVSAIDAHIDSSDSEDGSTESTDD